MSRRAAGSLPDVAVPSVQVKWIIPVIATILALMMVAVITYRITGS